MQTTSLPASPIKRNSKLDSPTKLLRQEVLKGKCKHYSPIFTRKSKYSAKSVDSSDEDITTSVEEMRLNHSYKNLESFQKAQMKQKLRRARSSKGDDRGRQSAYGLRQFMVHNKAPLWNENSQVYQLDSEEGEGLINRHSIGWDANDGKCFSKPSGRVMQFGRIDSNAYTLDFQYPFTALQAFAVALANVTQRLNITSGVTGGKKTHIYCKPADLGIQTATVSLLLWEFIRDRIVCVRVDQENRVTLQGPQDKRLAFTVNLLI
ncbi:hypothetical protein ScPMuIL_012806 [Solemya velum]